MEQIFTMFDDLKTCYRLKVHDVDGYSNMKESEKNSLCGKLREKIINHLNSDAVLFENHINSVVSDIRSKNS
jgi:hypothetical protein